MMQITFIARYKVQSFSNRASSSNLLTFYSGASDSDPEPPTTEEQIKTALQRLPPSTPPLSHQPEVTVLQQPPSNPTATLEPVDTEDRRETELFAQFLASGCTCGRPCMSQFTQDHVLDSRRDCQELSGDELDMVVLGQLHGSMNLSESCGPNHKHKAAQRQRSSVAYTHRGKPVCAKVFRFLHGVGMTH